MTEDNFINTEYSKVIERTGGCVWQTLESIATSIGHIDNLKMNEKNVSARVDSMSGLIKLMNSKYGFPLPDNPANYDELVTEIQRKFLETKKSVFEKNEGFAIRKFIDLIAKDDSDPVGKIIGKTNIEYKRVTLSESEELLKSGTSIALRINPYSDGNHIFHLYMCDGLLIDYSTYEVPVVLDSGLLSTFDNKLENIQGWNSILFKNAK